MIFSRLRKALRLLTTDEPLKALDEEAQARARLDCRGVGQARKAKRDQIHAQLAREIGWEWGRDR